MESSRESRTHDEAAPALPGQLRFAHSALPSAPGGVDFPTTPASAMIVRTYGIMCTNCVGMPCVPYGLICAANARDACTLGGNLGSVKGPGKRCRRARVLHPQPAMVSFQIPAQTAGGRAHDHTWHV